MKLAALVPALFVLVSMCGSPVPPPPGTITGLVFYDANHNAIHDVCDSGLGQVDVLASYADGTTTRTRSNGEGVFRIGDARPGDATVSIPAADGFVWPITTTPDGAAGVAVHVESNRESAGVEIGSASHAAFATSNVSIIGVIFNDTNENGVLDRNECGRQDRDLFTGQYVSVDNQPFVGVQSNGTYELRDVGGAADIVLETKPEITYVVGPFPDQNIRHDNPCFLRAKPQRRYSASLYEANIAYTLGTGTGAVTGHVFDDANGNGVRDAGEPGVPQQAIYLSPQGPTCGNGSSFFDGKETSGTTDADGEFTLANVPLGIYTVQFGGPQYYEGTPDPATIMTPGWRGDLTAKVLANKSTTVNLPLKVEQGSTIRVSVFDDASGDGARDTSEDAVDGYWICAHRSPQEQIYNQGYSTYQQGCGITDQDGVVLLRPLVSGQYEIPSDDGYRGIDTTTVPIRTLPVTQLIDLGEGEQLDVSLPLDVIPAEEQVIAEGAGTPVAFETCYSDPAWIQPPFEQAFVNDPNVYGPGGETNAREVYERGIYLGSGGDIGIWSQIIGRPDWLFMLHGCGGPPGDYSNANRLVVFADYEPVSVVSSGDVVQFTLARRQTGLYAALLPLNSPYNLETPEPIWFLFVDEGSDPIYRSNRYAGGGYGYIGGY